MPDITKCWGTVCPAKESCYRYTSEASDYQSYFMNPPYKDGKCDHYWGDTQESIWQQLLDITKNNDENV